MHKILVIAVLSGVLYLACSGGQPSGSQTATPQNLDSIRAEGRLIAKASFEALSQKLMQALEQGGAANAIQFCHANADPLTDSLSAKHGVRIRRVAEQNRNPANAPDEREQAFFNGFAAMKTQGVDLKTADTVAVLAPGKILFAKPILLQPQCVACHGKLGETVSEETYREIKKQYPEDRAVGFSPGDLRGMWAIYFEKN